MVEEVISGIYRLEIPLPGSPLRALNAYVLKGRDRFLVVDTGWNREECLHAMHVGLEVLGADLDKTDFFITHLHADHVGLVGELKRKNARVYIGEVDASISTSMRVDRKGRSEDLFRIFLAHGFPEAELRRAVESHPGYRYYTPVSFDFSILKDGDRMEIGDYSFICVETPGHSPGHMCLYEEDKQILFSGDHILFDITPNITRWPEMENSLERYLASLEKVYHLDVKLVLPGHRRIMGNHRKRIRELREHHARRLVEALRALANGEKTAWDVAPHLSWDIGIRAWDRFPPAQKWFALGETIAHLKYLEARGSVQSREYKDRLLFSLR
ncbi:MAG: MBL fold metallo-hydrolase [Deltaproteobacteria bacterium]|nr:MBL fold metallo-hydrolase [Deltaproteobacteria bacterium]